MKLNINVDVKELTEHIKKTCRRNLQKPAKICLICPFKEPILLLMDINKWKYHESLNKPETKKEEEPGKKIELTVKNKDIETSNL